MACMAAAAVQAEPQHARASHSGCGFPISPGSFVGGHGWRPRGLLYPHIARQRPRPHGGAAWLCTTCTETYLHSGAFRLIVEVCWRACKRRAHAGIPEAGSPRAQKERKKDLDRVGYVGYYFLSYRIASGSAPSDRLALACACAPQALAITDAAIIERFMCQAAVQPNMLRIWSAVLQHGPNSIKVSHPWPRSAQPLPDHGASTRLRWLPPVHPYPFVSVFRC
jgi:hypothetical protein